MSTTPKKLKALKALLENNNLFNVLQTAQHHTNHTSHTLADNTTPSLFGHLNPIHPTFIHIVDQNESQYLNSLSNSAQIRLIDALSHKHASYIVFQDADCVPRTFLQQKKIAIAVFSGNKPTAFEYLSNATQHIAIKQQSIHGAMAVIFDQGVLITGDSGSGKSSLLLALIERGHLWVADDAPVIYRNHFGHIYVTHPGHLSEYIHSKDIGVINADQTFGKSKRIPQHQLAAIIHLGNNVAAKNTSESILSAQDHVSILDCPIPKWNLSNAMTTTAGKTTNVSMIETIAKQLILKKWGEDAPQSLISAHDSVVSAVSD